MFDAWMAAKHGAEFRRCLVELDVRGVMRLFNAFAPDGAKVATEKEALYTLHMARALSQAVPLNLRQYSDRWLRERGLGAFLPRQLSELKHIRESVNGRQ